MRGSAHNGRRWLLANGAISLAGSAAPGALGVAATLIAARSNNVAEATLLLWAWTAMGFLSLSDFGLTRIASKSTVHGIDPVRVIARAWRVAIPAAALLTLAGAGLIAISDVPPIANVLLLLPLLIFLQFPVIGILEAKGAHARLAAQRSYNATFGYLVPAVAIVVAPAPLGIAIGFAAMVTYRVVSLFVLSRRAGSPVWRSLTALFRRVDVVDQFPPRLFWIGVSSLLGPLFLYGDRVALAAVGVPQEVWVFYVALSEILIKTYIIPASLTAVLFPWLSQNATRHLSRVRLFGLWGSATAICGAWCLGVVMMAVVPISWLDLLANVDDVGAVRIVAALLVGGTLTNWVAQWQIAVLHAFHAQRGVSVIQLVLLVPYLLGLLLAVAAGLGVVAIAFVWSMRIVLQALALLTLAAFVVRGEREPR